MSHAHVATVEWTAGEDTPFLGRRYSRAHRWRFDGGAEVPASSSPLVVPLPLSDPAGVDPEEALVASLSSCHMLFFLDLASRAGVDVTAYIDEAEGEMGQREDGRTAMLRVTLRPALTLAAPADDAVLADLHHRAHDLCFLANSINFPILVEPRA